MALLAESCTQDFHRFDPDNGAGGSGADSGEPDHCDNDTYDALLESDVDCGGDCRPCDLGERCGVDDDCESDHCADDVCCDSSCKGSNRSCGESGSEGHCQDEDSQ